MLTRFDVWEQRTKDWLPNGPVQGAKKAEILKTESLNRPDNRLEDGRWKMGGRGNVGIKKTESGLAGQQDHGTTGLRITGPRDHGTTDRNPAASLSAHLRAPKAAKLTFLCSTSRSRKPAARIWSS